MTKRTGVRDTLCIIAITIVFVMILSFFWDFYYGVNDDITTRNVLSGSYTGIPYPQGTQGTLTLYPITAVMSGLYTVISSVDHWGYFIVMSHLICFFIVAKSVMNRAKEHKTAVFVLTFTVFWVTDIINIVYFQFTTVAAVYAAVGIFLLLLENSDLKHHVPSICMFVLSFCVRKGTTGMIVPFIALVWLFKIYGKRDESLRIMKRAVCYCVILGIVCGGLFAIDICADWRGYRDEYYQEFETLRIKAWDYHGIPYYDSYPEFYQSLGNGQGISKEEFDLINTGNMTMDFSVDAKELLESMTQYSQYTYGFAALKDKLALSKDLFLTVFERETVKPLVLFIGLIWVLAAAYLIVHRKFLHLILLCMGVLGVVAEAACLLFVRRMPERIWQSLFLVAALWILGVCLQVQTAQEKTQPSGQYRGDIAVFVLTLLVSAGVVSLALAPAIDQKQATYEKQYQNAMEINQYCAEHTENVYCSPYTFFTTTDKLGRDSWYSNRFNNCIRIGFGSYGPAYRAMLEYAGISGTVEEAILTQDNVYMMGTYSDKSLPVFDAYFTWKYGDDYSYEVVDMPKDNMYVWKVRLKEDEK